VGVFVLAERGEWFAALPDSVTIVHASDNNHEEGTSCIATSPQHWLL
jgi:hypothetical protein